VREHGARRTAYDLIGGAAQQQPRQASTSVRFDSDQVGGVGLRVVEDGCRGMRVDRHPRVYAQSPATQALGHAFQVCVGVRLQFFEQRQIEACRAIASEFECGRRDRFHDPQKRVFGPHEFPESHGGLEDMLGLGRAVQRDQNVLQDGFGGKVREPFMGPQQ
jgi:hypothetical protein